MGVRPAIVDISVRADGADAVEDEEEKKAKNTFYTLMAYHSVEAIGAYETLVAFTQISPAKLQKMLIKDTIDPAP